MGRPHSAKSGQPMGQKDTGVETTHGKAQRGITTCQMDRRVVECQWYRTGHAGNQQAYMMIQIGHSYEEEREINSMVVLLKKLIYLH